MFAIKEGSGMPTNQNYTSIFFLALLLAAGCLITGAFHVSAQAQLSVVVPNDLENISGNVNNLYP